MEVLNNTMENFNVINNRLGFIEIFVGMNLCEV